MAESRVLYTKKGQVAYVTLNRPQVLNALDLQTHRELLEIWDDFERDTNIRVAVITGAGERSFSVGQDLKELQQRIARGEELSSLGSVGAPGWPRLTERTDITKPIIAKVNGYAFGGGFEIALACDLIIASDKSTFALPEAKLGLIAGAGGIFRLTRQLPYKVAMGYLMTGRTIEASRAYELGLINQCVNESELDDCVDEWLTDILRCAPHSVRAIKEVASKSRELTMDDAFKENYDCENSRKKSPDSIEGPKAFIEKRQPVWKKGN